MLSCAVHVQCCLYSSFFTVTDVLKIRFFLFVLLVYNKEEKFKTIFSLCLLFDEFFLSIVGSCCSSCVFNYFILFVSGIDGEDIDIFNSEFLVCDESEFLLFCIWSDLDPHETVEVYKQHQFSLNVWVGIVGNHLLGPYMLPRGLNAEAYFEFL